MTTKIGAIVLALLAAWFLLVKPALGGGKAAARKVAKGGGTRDRAEPTALEPCPRCGVYRAAGGSCGCETGRPAGG